MARSKVSNDLILTLVFSLFYTAVFVFTNIYDWDYVFTTLEVDLRSIVIDGKLPSWSYQMCGGSSRAGDPQSFGFSPLMIFPILFGSFWGAKILLFIAVVVGIHFFKKILVLLKPDLKALESHFYILIFLTSNFFLFHFSNGHLSFSSIFYAFPLLYLCIKIILNKTLQPKEYLLNSFFLFLLMSGGFYQASIYFIFPLALSFGMYWILSFKQIQLLAVLKLAASSLVPLLLTIYRWVPVMEYQKQFPRTLGFIEWNNPIQQILYFLLPINKHEYIFPFKPLEYSAGEDSFFGAVPLIFLFLLIFRFKALIGIFKECRPVIKLSFCLISVGVLLSLGNLYGFLPFAIINKIFSGSIRVPGRFNLITYIGLSILLLDSLNSLNLQKKAMIKLYIFGVLISLAGYFQHYSEDAIKISLFHTRQVMEIEPIYEGKMQKLHVTRMRNGMMSNMYIPTLLGVGVPNCYQPMKRKAFFMIEKVGEMNKPFDLHFLRMDDESYSEECLKSSFFTQAELYLDKSCRPGTYFNLNFIRDDMIKKYGIQETNRGYRL